jgi:predicted DCC family thiol-disulfide oxidoreductase YuxK
VSGTILFDGVCNLCNGFVRFVIQRDPDAHFRFAALSSDAAAKLLADSGVDGVVPDSVVLIQDGRVYFRSDVPLRIARGLTLPWTLLSVFRVVPRFLRDRLYDFIAARRYRWFGRRDICMVPTPEMKKRFLE